MKNITLILALLAIVSFSSCRKDRTCVCVTENSGVISETTTQFETVRDVTRNEAIDECDLLDSEWVQSGLEVEKDCSLSQ